jgi:xylulokinase
LAEKIEPGADGLRLRTGVAMTDPQSIFAGLSPRHTAGHQVRCIMEAVAGALQGQIAELSDGSPAIEIRCAGGGAQSDLWLQIKADLLGVETVATICPEPTSLGAAMLAEASLTKIGLQEVARHWVKLKPPHRPDRQSHIQYQKLFENT